VPTKRPLCPEFRRIPRACRCGMAILQQLATGKHLQATALAAGVALGLTASQPVAQVGGGPSEFAPHQIRLGRGGGLPRPRPLA